MDWFTEMVLPFILGPATAVLTIIIAKKYDAKDLQRERDREAREAVERYVYELQLRADFAEAAVSSYDDFDGTACLIARPNVNSLGASFIEARRFFSRLDIKADEKRHFSVEGPHPSTDPAVHADEYLERAFQIKTVLDRGLKPEEHPATVPKTRHRKNAQ